MGAEGRDQESLIPLILKYLCHIRIIYTYFRWKMEWKERGVEGRDQETFMDLV